MILTIATNTGAPTAILSSVTEAREAPWNDIVGATPTAQHGSLKTFESTSALGTRPIYFALGGVERPTAVAIGYLATEKSHYAQLARPLLGRATRLAPALVRMLGPTLVLALRPSYGVPVLADSQRSQREQESLLNELLNDIESYAGEQGLSLAVVGTAPRDQAINQVLRNRAFQETQSYPTAELEVSWNSWDGYLMHLKRRRRNTIRKESAVFDGAGCRIRALDPSEPLPKNLYTLFQEHYQRRNSRPAPYNEHFLEDLRQNLPDNSRIYVAEMDDRTVGFMAALWKDQTAAAVFIGIGHDAREQKIFTYFNFIYELVRDAPALGWKRIHFGSTAYDAKRFRGCTISPAGLFLRPASRLTRLVGKPAMAAHRYWYERKFRHLLGTGSLVSAQDIGAPLVR
jgi:hypothetical protein